MRFEGFHNLQIARAEVLSFLESGERLNDSAIPPDALPASHIPSVQGGDWRDRDLAEIDQDGFAFATSPVDEPYFNRRAARHARGQHDVRIVLRDRHVRLLKRYCGVAWGAKRDGNERVGSAEWFHRNLWTRLGSFFYTETAALLRLRHLPFVPKIRSIDLRSRTLTMDYLHVQSLRRVAADAGQPRGIAVYDLDRQQAAAGGTRVSSAQVERLECELLRDAMGDRFIREMCAAASAMRRHGVVPLDIRFANVLRGVISGTLYWIDFELARFESQPGWGSALEQQAARLSELLGAECAVAQD